jgi:hypothetical protein
MYKTRADEGVRNVDSLQKDGEWMSNITGKNVLKLGDDRIRIGGKKSFA